MVGGRGWLVVQDMVWGDAYAIKTLNMPSFLILHFTSIINTSSYTRSVFDSIEIYSFLVFFDKR